MDYAKLKELMPNTKKRKPNDKMQITTFRNFSVMESDKIDSIIVDNDIVQDICGRKWCEDSGGYPVARINNELVRLHDYVMSKQYSCKPNGCYVDHINQDKHDNRLNNLRFVTPEDSSKNMPLKANNTSGTTGVSKTKYNTYRAYITSNKTRIDLGQYKTIEEAIAARREAEARLDFKTRPGTIKQACDKGEEK